MFSYQYQLIGFRSTWSAHVDLEHDAPPPRGGGSLAGYVLSYSSDAAILDPHAR